MGIERTKLGHGDTIDSGSEAAATAPPAKIRPAATGQSSDHSVDPEQLAAQIQSAADLPVVDRDHYRMISEHARGGLGRIVRARDRRTGRVVAIKEMLGSSDDAARRFAREALITANLQHPAIVPVYELGRWASGEPFYAMKLVSGRSFEEVIRGCKSLDDRLARLPIVVSVAEALAYAHGTHIIHRDLKPANVLVGDFGETVVIDWGLAKTIGPDGTEEPSFTAQHPSKPPERAIEMTMPLTGTNESTKTHAGAVMGTPAFMPPEQARGEAADERADVYAIGAMLYQLISGAAPYADRKPASSRALLDLVKAGPPTPLDAREPGTPSDLGTIVAKAMAHDRSARYANGGELADDLRRFTTGQLVRAHHYDRRTLVARWLRRHRAAVTVAAVLTSALAIFAVWSVKRIVAERDVAIAQTELADLQLATALYEKGRIAEGASEWGRAAMYYAASRTHHDTPAATWAAGLAEARAIAPFARHLGHTAWVRALAIAPDGARVATVDDAGWLRVWSPRDGATIAAAQLSKKAVYAVAFAPDGNELAAAGDDAVILLLDARTLAKRGELRGHVGRVWSLAYSPDGATLASGGEDATVRLWNLATHDARELHGHALRVYSVAFSPDGKRLASGSDDRKLWIWDVATGKGEVRGEHAAGGIRVVAFASRDLCPASSTAGGRCGVIDAGGDAIVTAGWDHGVKLWRDGKPRNVWIEPHTVHGGAIEPRTGLLAIGGDLNAIHILDMTTHRIVGSLDAPAQVTAVGFSRDGALLVTAGKDGVPIAWDASALRRVAGVGHLADVDTLAFSEDGKRLVSGSNDRTMRVWDVATGDELVRVATAALCGDGALALRDGGIAATCDDATLRRWDASGRESAAPIATGVWLRFTSLSPDGATIAAGHIRGRVALFDVAAWQRVADQALHDHHIYGVMYASDGRLVTASLDDHVKVWRGRELVRELDVKVGTDDGILAAALSPDGALLALGTQDGVVDVWDVKASAWRAKDLARSKSQGTVWRLAYARDGAHVFTANQDGSVLVWDARTWRDPVALDAKEGVAATVAESPDGKLLAAGYKSGAIVLWDLATRTVKLRIGGRARDRGNCADVTTQKWVDAAHRAIVEAACTTDPDVYFTRVAVHTHQRLDRELDVAWEWVP